MLSLAQPEFSFQTVSRSTQPFLHRSRQIVLYFTTGRPQFPFRMRVLAACHIWFPWHSKLHTTNDIWIGSAVLQGLRSWQSYLNCTSPRPLECDGVTSNRKVHSMRQSCISGHWWWSWWWRLWRQPAGSMPACTVAVYSLCCRNYRNPRYYQCAVWHSRQKSIRIITPMQDYSMDASAADYRLLQIELANTAQSCCFRIIITAKSLVICYLQQYYRLLPRCIT